MKKWYFLLVLLVLAGCTGGGTNSTAEFDVPTLLAQDYNTTEKALGKPSMSEISQDSGAAARLALWENPKGYSVAIYFDSVTKRPRNVVFNSPSDFADSEKAKLLEPANLSLDDAKYTVKFVPLKGNPQRFTAIVVKPTG